PRGTMSVWLCSCVGEWLEPSRCVLAAGLEVVLADGERHELDGHDADQVATAIQDRCTAEPTDPDRLLQLEPEVIAHASGDATAVDTLLTADIPVLAADQVDRLSQTHWMAAWHQRLCR